MEYIDIKNEYTKEDVNKIKEVIENGGVCVLPTDTVYGLVCDAFSESAIKKIYDIKKRNSSKPMNILVSNIDMIKQVTNGLSIEEENIAKKYFPGALTIIFKKNDTISNIITAGLDTLGVRMPNHKVLLEIIELLRKTSSSD